eukprot:7578577-Prorocentrum_lima.AAC.1
MEADITIYQLSERAGNVRPRVPIHQVGNNDGWPNACDWWLSPTEGRSLAETEGLKSNTKKKQY